MLTAATLTSPIVQVWGVQLVVAVVQHCLNGGCIACSPGQGHQMHQLHQTTQTHILQG